MIDFRAALGQRAHGSVGSDRVARTACRHRRPPGPSRPDSRRRCHFSNSWLRYWTPELAALAADLDLHPQHEIVDGPLPPDAEGVVFRHVVGGRFADDRAVLDRPDLRIAVPAVEIRAVEDRLKARFVVGGAQSAAPAARRLRQTLPTVSAARANHRRTNVAGKERLACKHLWSGQGSEKWKGRNRSAATESAGCGRAYFSFRPGGLASSPAEAFSDGPESAAARSTAGGVKSKPPALPRRIAADCRKRPGGSGFPDARAAAWPE